MEKKRSAFMSRLMEHVKNTASFPTYTFVTKDKEKLQFLLQVYALLCAYDQDRRNLSPLDFYFKLLALNEDQWKGCIEHPRDALLVKTWALKNLQQSKKKSFSDAGYVRLQELYTSYCLFVKKQNSPHVALSPKRFRSALVAILRAEGWPSIQDFPFSRGRAKISGISFQKDEFEKDPCL